MRRLSQIASAVALAATVATTAVPLTAQAAIGTQQTRSCFFANSWRGWSSPSPDKIYLRINSRDVYQVDLVGNNRQLKSPGSFLISKVSGSNSICSAIDLNLAVSDGHGFQTPLFTKQLTKLSPEEVAAIPRKYQP